MKNMTSWNGLRGIIKIFMMMLESEVDMAMSDCPKCWETPCICGYDYKDYDEDKLFNLIVAILSHHNETKQLNVLNSIIEEII